MSNERSLGMKWIAAALAVTGMAAGGWAYARHTTSVAAAAPRAAAASAPASLDTEATPRSRSTRRWQLGDSFVYAVDAARTITMGAPLDHRIDLKLAGALALTVIGVNGDEVRVRADLRQARYEQTPKPPRDPAAELARPFYFTASRAGAFGAYAFPRGMSAEARGLLKGLATSLQVVITGAYEWQTVEQDVSGEYEARYERAGSSIHKAKTRYLRGRSGKGLVPRSDGEYQVRSSNEIDLDDSGWPRSAVEDESLHIKLGEAGVGAVNKATSRLVAVERRLDLAGAADDPNVEPESVSEAAAFALASVQADRALVGGRSFKQITAELTSNDADARSHARAHVGAHAPRSAGGRRGQGGHPAR